MDCNAKAYNFFPYNDIRVECYCKECKKRRIFCFENSPIALNSIIIDTKPIAGSMNAIGNSSMSQGSLKSALSDIDFFTFYAQADCKHKMVIDFMKIDENTIMKIGQIPSTYDLNEEINNKGFLKILGDEYSEYYKKACYLYSIGAFIGSLIYLRRIFEKLLIDTYSNNKDSLGISFDAFKGMRMDNKLEKLKPFLPSVMFSQGFNKIYTKISNGIHNLDEGDCDKIFLVLKMGIEEILSEQLEKTQKEKRIKELNKELQNI